MSDKLNIELLSNNNWHKWKIQMRRYLESKELWMVVEDGDATAVQTNINNASESVKATLKTKNATAMSLMLQTVDESSFNVIQSENHAHAMWKKLKDRYEYQSAAAQRLVFNEWKSLSYNNGGSIRDYISKFDSIAARYIAVGGKLDDNQKALQLLHSIQSDRYDYVVKSPSTMNLSYDELCTQLMMYEDTWVKQSNGDNNNTSNHNNNQNVEAALVTSQRRNNNSYYNNNNHYNNNNNNNNNNRNWRSNTVQHQYQYRGRQHQSQQNRAVVCYECGGNGHKSYECPTRNRQNDNRMNTRRNFNRHESSNVAYTKNDNNGNEYVLVMDKRNEIAGWLIDSGASHHITHDKSLLLNYRTIERQAINGFSENSVDYAIGEGDVKLSVNINGIDKNITITSVWYVPGAHKNLLSVSAVMNKGCA
jgi:hypothetical protein